MQLSIGFSSCPNDTFMLDALIHKRLDRPSADWVPHIADVETLNNWALEARLDVTKMSFATWLRVNETYDLLSAGAALGRGCGPLLIAKHHLDEAEINRGPVAIPGELTTANLLFRLRYPKSQITVQMLFSEIEDAVLSGAVSAGVIIHENRFTYAEKGLLALVDLGEFWESSTGLPIPLGAFAIKRSLGHEARTTADRAIRASVSSAFSNPELAMPYVRAHAQEMQDSVMQAHIRTYVNEYSIQLGDEGMRAIEVLRSRAREAQLIPS